LSNEKKSLHRGKKNPEGGRDEAKGASLKRRVPAERVAKKMASLRASSGEDREEMKDLSSGEKGDLQGNAQGGYGKRLGSLPRRGGREMRREYSGRARTLQGRLHHL